MNGTVKYQVVNDQCEWHHGLCAYSQADASRCPLCHVRWALIDRSGRHSCLESNGLFAPSMRKRVPVILAEARTRYEASVSAV